MIYLLAVQALLVVGVVGLFVVPSIPFTWKARKSPQQPVHVQQQTTSTMHQLCLSTFIAFIGNLGFTSIFINHHLYSSST